MTRTIYRIATIAAVLLIGTLGFALPGRSHQDTIFEIDDDGRLSRIPDEFGPVFIRVEGSVEIPTVSLKLPARTVSLPPCLSRLFFVPKGETIRAKGSWYHSRSVLPPYISFDLPQKTIASGFYNGYSLMFNLESGELLEVSRHKARPDGTGVAMEALPTEPPCELDRPLQLRPRSPGSQTSTIEVLE